MESAKKPWLSKTLWVNALVAIFAIAYPPASAWMAEHMDIVVAVFAGLNMILRLITKDKIGFEE